MSSHALVLGKFLPLHLGHLALFREAQRIAEHVTIVLGPRWDEPIPAGVRERWLRESMPAARVVTVSDVLPSLPEQDPEQFWPRWREALLAVVPDVTHVVTSEAYGDRLAAELGAEHHCFDRNRLNVSVSASRIRQDPWTHWDMLAPAARPWFLRRVALVGGESTGKTTLAQQLAVHFRTAWVSEYGREHMAGRSIATFTSADAVAITRRQADREREARHRARGLVIADTEALVTAAWTMSCGLEVPQETWTMVSSEPFDLYLLCRPDLAWTQDGTREVPHLRAWFFGTIRTELERRGLPWKAIHGTGEARMACAIDAVKAATDHWWQALRSWKMSESGTRTGDDPC